VLTTFEIFQAIAMGEQYPSAEIIATDISVFQLGDLPSNVTLEIDDIEDEWTFPQNSFDFIHLRDMSGSISDWKSVYREAFKCLVPGGQIEISDFGDTSTSNSSNLFQTIYSSEIQSASEVAGTPLGVKHLERNIFEDIGYVEIRNVMIRVPLGMWPSDANRKTVGKLMLIGTLEGLEAKSLRLLTKCKGWSAEDVTELCTKVKAEMLADQSLHRYISLHIVIAQKPF
jgi:SAM-dependent methyltransferase